MGVLAARCTLAIALATATIKPPPPPHHPPHWVRILMEKNIDHTWLDAFQASFIHDLSPATRTGAYISLDPGDIRLGWIDHLPVMAYANVPIYLSLPGRSYWSQACGEFPWLQALEPHKAHFVPVPDALRGPVSDVACIARDPSYGLSRHFRWDRINLPPPRATARPSSQPSPAPGPSSQPFPGFAQHGERDLSKVPKGKGQKYPGEPWSAFFARRDSENEDKVKAEDAANDAKAQQAREAREQRRIRHAGFEYAADVPIFLWVEVGDIDSTVHPDFLQLDYRRLLPKKGRFAIWKQHSTRQKRYDPFRNEWDICPPLHPGDEISDDDDDDDFPMLTYAPLREPLRNAPPVAASRPAVPYVSNASSSSSSSSLPPTPSTAQPAPTRPPAPSSSSSSSSSSTAHPVFISSPVVSSSRRLQSPPARHVAHESQPAEEGEIPHFLMSAFSADLTTFYSSEDIGYRPEFYPAVEVLRKHLGVVRIDEPPAEWMHIAGYTSETLRKVMGYLRSDNDDAGFPVDDNYIKCFRAFVDGIIKKPPSPPAAVWDLHSLNPQYLMRAGYLHPSMQATKRQLSGKWWYYIRYNADDTLQYDWELVVPDAATVVTLYRVHMVTDRKAAAEYLLTAGMPFRTLFTPDHRTTMELRLPVPVWLGWRPDTASLGKHDYRYYEKRVYDLLRGPKGRAALLRGGIVWRIAMEIMHGGLVEAALAGPSEDVYYYGEMYRPDHGDDSYDDGLTNDELRLICGVYRVCSSAYEAPSSSARIILIDTMNTRLTEHADV